MHQMEKFVTIYKLVKCMVCPWPDPTALTIICSESWWYKP